MSSITTGDPAIRGTAGESTRNVFHVNEAKLQPGLRTLLHDEPTSSCQGTFFIVSVDALESPQNVTP